MEIGAGVDAVFGAAPPHGGDIAVQAQGELPHHRLLMELLDPGRPDLKDLIIVASTEVNTDADRAAYAAALAKVLAS